MRSLPQLNFVRRAILTIVASIGQERERVVRQFLDEESSMGRLLGEDLDVPVGLHVGDERSIGQILSQVHFGEILRHAVRSEGDDDRRLIAVRIAVVHVDVDGGQRWYGVIGAVRGANDQLEDVLRIETRQFRDQTQFAGVRVQLEEIALLGRLQFVAVDAQQRVEDPSVVR